MNAQDQDTVTVYGFAVFDLDTKSMCPMPYKAEREAILRRFGAEARILEGTAQHVDRDELDGDGHWRRIPTGWGDLS